MTRLIYTGTDKHIDVVTITERLKQYFASPQFSQVKKYGEYYEGLNSDIVQRHEDRKRRKKVQII